MEEARRDARAQFEAIAEAFEGLVYVCSQDYVVEYMNRRFVERTGRDATGEKCYRALHELEDVCEWCVNDRVLNGETVRWEVLSPKDDRWYSVVDVPIRHPDGRISKLALIEDVDESKRAKAALARVLDIIDFLPDATFVIDADKRVIAWNRATEEMTGALREDLLGQGDYAYAVPWYGERRPILVDLIDEDGPPWAERYDYVRRQGDTLYAESFVPRLRNGKGAYLWATASPLFDAAGNRAGAIESVRDITERRLREEALAAVAESQRQAQAIGASIPFGPWLAEPDGRMTYLSDSFLEMSGQTMEQARDYGWLEALAPETAEATRRDWDAAVVSRTPWNHELVVEGVDGHRRTVLSRGFPIADESGRVTSWAGINMDITDRKEAEAFREAFLGILSHELRTPITSIYAASTLLSRPRLKAARREELIGDIGHEAERLGRLVDDLVILSRAERGTIQVHTEPVLLRHVMRRICEQERRRHPANRLRLSVAPALPVARADEDFVEQIVRNLLENAVKYGPPDGEIELIVDAPDGCPRVRVLDRGPGIDPAEADRLFEVFYRSERAARVAGSGIGLFVAHRLVESIGGTIWARPRDDGPGAEFGFRLQPFAEDAG